MAKTNVTITNVAMSEAATLAALAQSTAAKNLGGGSVTGVNLVDGRDVSVDGTKLDGVEALADVTDTGNVGPVLVTLGLTPLYRVALAASSQLTGATANVEAIHTALPLTTAMLGTARRTVEFFARLVVTGDNAADTWRVRLRLGGLIGTLIGDLGAIDIAAGQVITLEGSFQTLTTGAGGTFDGQVRLWDPVAAEYQQDSVAGGAVDTTGTVNLVVTGLCSSNNAGNIVQLRDFSAKVWGG